MNILRLSTLSLAVAIAVFALAYASPSFAGKKCDADPTHPSCKDAGGDAEYKAALTMGGFIFEPLIVTLNKRKNAYHGEEPVGMIRDDAEDISAWNLVFGTCSLLLLTDITGFTAGDNWTINVSGRKLDGGSVSDNPESDILIRFRDVVVDNYPFVDIDFNLIGKIEDNKFLPESGETSSFTLDRFNFFASGSQGESCRSGIFPLIPPSVLTIERT